MSQDRARPYFIRMVLEILLLIPPILFMTRWVVVSGSASSSQSEIVSRFLSVFPVALQDATLLTSIAIVFSVAAVVIAALPKPGASGQRRLVSMVVILFGSLLALWLLFSLM